jgi:hypothetical protein
MTVAIALERFIAVHYPIDYSQVIATTTTTTVSATTTTAKKEQKYE